MIAVDTNVLVRVLVDDPEEERQVGAARARVRTAGQVWVPQIVQVETVWVLESAYAFAKDHVINTLDHVRSNQAYVLDHPTLFDDALREFRTGEADFADYLILAATRVAGYELATFDQQLLRSADTTAV